MNTLDTMQNPQQNVSPRPTGVRYGLIAGLILIAIALAFHVTGMIDYTQQNSAMTWISSLLSYGIMIGAAVLGMKKHREDLGGYLTFGQGFMVGLWETLVIAAITGIWSVLFFSVVAPDVIDTMIEAARDQMAEQQGLNDEQIEQAMKITGWMMQPATLSGLAAFGTLFTGLIISLITAAIMKRNPPMEATI